jgi:hypothetical protein
MPSKKLTAANIEFIKANRLIISGSDMARKLGVSKTCVGSYMRNNGLVVDAVTKNKFRADANIGKTTFTSEQDKFIKANYLLMPIKTLAKKINKSSCGVYGRLRFFGLKIPQELADERKKTGMYRKNAVPMNKGKKQSDYMSTEAIERTKATRYQKGQRPHNSYPVGTIIEKKEKFSERIYKYEVQPQGKMELYHKMLWERKNGKVPLKHCLWFKDGYPLNLLPVL